jgi:hypothetical protein
MSVLRLVKKLMKWLTIFHYSRDDIHCGGVANTPFPQFVPAKFRRLVTIGGVGWCSASKRWLILSQKSDDYRWRPG